MSRMHSLTIVFELNGVAHEWTFSLRVIRLWVFLTFVCGLTRFFLGIFRHSPFNFIFGIVLIAVAILITEKLNRDLEADRQAWIRELSGKDSE
jgi:hypothetical protein